VTTFAEIALFTDDVEAAKGFYSRLLHAEPVAEWPEGAIYAANGGKLLVHARSAAMEGGPPNEDHFALAVDDLDRACEALRADGVELLVPPRDYPWGRSAYLRDPDGRLVELTDA
jgi:catechol 2,3-dioxygenase-like lactoylglutathione lyase family enzyme